MLIERGQLSFVFLDPVFGKEIGGYKTRPVVVISINDLNTKGLPVLVVPGTSAERKPDHFKNVVRVEPTRENGLKNRDFSLNSTVIRCIPKESGIAEISGGNGQTEK